MEMFAYCLMLSMVAEVVRNLQASRAQRYSYKMSLLRSGSRQDFRGSRGRSNLLTSSATLKSSRHGAIRRIYFFSLSANIFFSLSNFGGMTARQ